MEEKRPEQDLLLPVNAATYLVYCTQKKCLLLINSEKNTKSYGIIF